MLVVVQDEMGKSSASNSATEALNEFCCNLFVCLGIAGGLSKDLKLGDVCHSGNVLDVNDNAKTTDNKEGGISLELSPFTYRTDKALSLALDFVRRDPISRTKYEEWQKGRSVRASELGIEEIHDNKGAESTKASTKIYGRNDRVRSR